MGEGRGLFGQKASASSPFFRFEELAALDPEAKQAIKDRQIPNVEVAVFTPSPRASPIGPRSRTFLDHQLGIFKANSRVSIPGQN